MTPEGSFDATPRPWTRSGSPAVPGQKAPAYAYGSPQLQFSRSTSHGVASSYVPSLGNEAPAYSNKGSSRPNFTPELPRTKSQEFLNRKPEDFSRIPAPANQALAYSSRQRSASQGIPGLNEKLKSVANGNKISWGRARTLIELGANANVELFDGQTLLHKAASLGRAEVVKFLIGAGADVNATDSSGKTPLDFASNQEMQNLLTNKGAVHGSAEVSESESD
jgi:ankyrin repeat protein